MAKLEIGVHPELPEGLLPALRAHLAQRWPDLDWTPLRLPAARRDARDGPLLVVLPPDVLPPPGDPGELSVVRWDSQAEMRGREPLFLQVDVEIARVTAGRSGQAPVREVSPPPREMTRRALLQIPLPLGRPLPPTPWLEAELCVHGKGCDRCAAICPTTGAVRLDGAVAAIDPALCTGCGACVAACPTGALTSAYLGDEQWQAALAVLAASPSPSPLVLRCSRMPAETPDGIASLPVACIGEVGWDQLVTSLAELGRLPDLGCEKSDCPLRPQARAALGRLERLRGLNLGPGTPAQVPEAPKSPAAPRRTRLARSLRRLAASLPDDAKEDTWPGLGWTVHTVESENRCTLCSGCVHACPTAALAIEEGTDATTLTLDAALCTGCGACSDICPEKVLEVSAATVAELLGPQEVFHAEKALCKRCGVPYESPSFVAALHARMEAAGFSGALLDRLDYCPECRAALPG